MNDERGKVASAIKDLADVLRLIRERTLTRSFKDQVNEYVRGEYERLWQLAQKPEDEY